MVSPKSKADLELLDFLLTPAKNFKNYRKRLVEVPDTDSCIPICSMIPYVLSLCHTLTSDNLGMILADITFIYEIPVRVNGMVNVERVHLMCDKIKDFLSFQRRPYTDLQSVEVHLFVFEDFPS